MNIKNTILRLVGLGFSADEAIDMAGAAETTRVDDRQPAFIVQTDNRPPVKVFAGRKVNPFLVDGDDARTATDSRYEPVFPTTRSASEAVEPVKRRKRHYRPRVGYRLTTLARNLAAGKGTAKQRDAFKNLYPVAADCLKAVAKSKAPLSNRDIEKATDHGKKSVESSVYQLRHFGLIESVSLTDTE